MTSKNKPLTPERFGMTKDGKLILVMPTNVILGEILWKSLQWDFKNTLSVEGELKFIPKISTIIPCLVLQRKEEIK